MGAPLNERMPPVGEKCFHFRAKESIKGNFGTSSSESMPISHKGNIYSFMETALSEWISSLI